MMPRFAIACLGIASFAAAQSMKCVAVVGDRILARDFAAALPAFEQLSPETPIGYAPAPGVRRVFRSFEVDSLARRYSVDAAPAGDICFERATEALDRNKIMEAMKEALPIPDLRMEILEISLFPVPRGRLEFRREGLATPASPDARTPVTWRGNVVYGDNRRFGVWARVVISAPVARVVATARLKRGEPIADTQVRVESIDRFPAAGDLAQNLSQVVGRIPLRDFAEGTEIRPTLLTSAPDVNCGDMVEVEVRSGAARLTFTAKAESSGRTGDAIAIRNLSSNKIFRARVDGKGKAFLDAGRGQGN